MSNMSYCQFQNTRRDFFICKETMRDLLERETAEGPLSFDELTAAKELACLAFQLVHSLARFAHVDHVAVKCIDEAALCAVLDDANDDCRIAKES